MGGENLSSRATWSANAGPSPRGWGERAKQQTLVASRRTIPTWVGRTQHSLNRVRPNADHPHVGGENGAALMPWTLIRGPSPRGWGELHSFNCEGSLWRTIPTWVGRTDGAGAGGVRSPDHPHVGGENDFAPEVVAPLLGPSPRGWGEPRLLATEGGILRTIPTWVGRTPVTSSGTIAIADHPHVGGENFRKKKRPPLEYGPSPRGWGERR